MGSSGQGWVLVEVRKWRENFKELVEDLGSLFVREWRARALLTVGVGPLSGSLFWLLPSMESWLSQRKAKFCISTHSRVRSGHQCGGWDLSAQRATQIYIRGGVTGDPRAGHILVKFNLSPFT